MSILSKQQAEMMFRSTDKLLYSASFSPYDNNSDKDMEAVLEYFHCREVYQLDLNDDYFKGIRANTFCIEVGWSETYLTEKHGRDCSPVIYIVTANHKGTRMFTMYAIDDYPWCFWDNEQQEVT